MGSIPLPALAVQPPRDPLEEFSRVAQLKGMLQQQQQQAAMAPLQQKLAQQSVQSGEIENQQNQAKLALAQQNVRDQQLVQQHMQDNPGDTFADAASKLKGKISLNAYTNLMDTDATIRQKNSQATTAELANAKTQHDMYQEIYNNAQSVPDDKFLANWPNLAASVKAVPGNTIPLDPTKPMTKQQFSQFGPMVSMNEAYLTHELDRRKEIAEVANKELQNQFLAQAGGTAEQREGRYQSILANLAAGKQVSDADLTFAKGHELANRKTTVSSDTLGVTSTNTSGPSGLAALGNRQGGRFVPPAASVSVPSVVPGATLAAGAPAAGGGVPAAPGTGGGAAPAAAAGSAAGSAAGTKESIVDMIGNYKLNPTMLQRMSTKHPDILAMVGQKYPDFDQTTYNAKNHILQSYTSGPESKSINAINTAMGHAGELGSAIDALNNGDVGLNSLRALGNRIGVETGGDAVTTFNLIVHRLAPEISSAYVQGGGGEKERAADAADFDASLGGKQLRSNLAETVKLLRSKISAQENQWNTTFQPKKDSDQFQNRFITPQARDTLAKYSAQAPTGNSGGAQFSVKAPNGKTYNFPDQDSADSFKKRAGIP